MCGILGAWGVESLPDEAIESALQTLRHRGPNDSGVVRHGPVVLGMRRLSIIDVAGGHQPIANEDGSVVVICNGEIYNYQELTSELRGRGHRFSTRSDTEVLVHLYEELGEQMCLRLRGMFAFALYDDRRQRLLLGRDRFGKKPLYLASPPSGGLLFGSELKALRCLARPAGLSLRPDAQAVYDYLSIGAVPQPSTIYRECRALPPAAVLTCDAAGVAVRSYWAVDYSNVVQRDHAEVLERTRALIGDATRLRLRSDVPLGVFLSGGLDSSVVAAEAAAVVGSNLQTFTAAMDSAPFDESHRASRTAQALNVHHTVIPVSVAPLQGLLNVVRAYDQPFWDSSSIPSMAVARVARQAVTVVLTGDGGDELFAGYRHHLAPWVADRAPWLPRVACKLTHGVLRALQPTERSRLGQLERFVRGFVLDRGGRQLSWSTDLLGEAAKQEVWVGPRCRPTEEWVESLLPKGVSALRTQLHGDIAINLLSDMLVKVDIATMAASVEARSPLLDHELAEFVFSVPDELLIGGGQPKRLLREAYASRLPEEVLCGPKQGFEVPLRQWLTGPLREVTQDTLRPRTARTRQWLDGKFVDRLLSGTSRSQVLYAILMLELWFREHG